MRLLKYRVSADDPQIHYPRACWHSLHAENYSEGILLFGLPLHLEQRRRAYPGPPLASFLSWPRVGQREFVGQPLCSTGAIDSSRAILLVIDLRLLRLPQTMRASHSPRSERRVDSARIHSRALTSMKWLFALLLALIIFGGAAWFGYNFFVKEEIEVKKEQRGEVAVAPTPDISLPEFQAAAKLRQEGKLTETLDALLAFIQKYP